MVRRERESTGQIARFRLRKLQIPAISKCLSTAKTRSHSIAWRLVQGRLIMREVPQAEDLPLFVQYLPACGRAKPPLVEKGATLGQLPAAVPLSRALYRAFLR